MTDIRETAEAPLVGEIYDVEQKIYSDLHLGMSCSKVCEMLRLADWGGRQDTIRIYESGNFAG